MTTFLTALIYGFGFTIGCVMAALFLVCVVCIFS